MGFNSRRTVLGHRDAVFISSCRRRCPGAFALAVRIGLVIGLGVGQAYSQAIPDRKWQDEVTYVIVIEKFFDGNRANDFMLRRFGREKSRYEGGLWGGDLEGVIQKLDYLSSLGVTALLLYPAVANDTMPLGKYLATGYRPRDYFHVDENFGNLATLQRLVQAAHERKMRVILDLPLGFPGVEHPYTPDPSKSGWFGKMSEYGVRLWNTDNPQVADYLIKVSRFWKDQTHCDGFRLDSAQVHSAEFWKRYARELKGLAGSQDFFLLAELPMHPSKIGEFITATGLDSAYDFSAGVAREVFGNGANVNQISFVQREANRFYPHPLQLCAQIDQYENPEFITTAKDPKDARMKLAMTYLLTLNRIPLIYSGDEVAASYREVGGLFTPARQASPFLQYTKHLIAVRRKEIALRRGNLVEVQSANPIYAYLRTYGDNHILVILNNSHEPQSVSFPMGGKQWRDCSLYDLLAARRVKTSSNAQPITIEPFGARVLRVSD